MAETPERKPHIFTPHAAASEEYRYPGGGSSETTTRERNREAQGRRLLGDLDEVKTALEQERAEPPPTGMEREEGMYVRFESDPGFALQFESLENRKQGIDLAALKEVHRLDDVAEPAEETELITIATVFVPEGKLEFFERRIQDYLEKETKKGSPRHQALVESIAHIRLAKLEDLWTETEVPFPAAGEIIWWEAWLRTGSDGEKRQTRLTKFRTQANRADLSLSPTELHFPEHSVLLINGSCEELTDSVWLLDSLAEVRKAHEAADFFLGIDATEAAEWVDDTLNRTDWPEENAPTVCLLDTGVNRAHPLLSEALYETDMHAYDPEWGVAANPNPTGGHGTEMAGLALFGDLAQVLGTMGPIELRHRLESVKILPPTGDNEPQLYGAITRECVSRAEIQAPARERAICLAVTSDEDIDRGRPSSWSAALDQISSGAGEDQRVRRLFVVASGNASDDSVDTYPDGNETDSVHDPAQAWNSLTVGAYTDKINIDEDKYANWAPLAPRGDLSPRTTTSLIWENQWPLKPDVVLEGGNYSLDDMGSWQDGPDSLRLLTTRSNFLVHPFTTIGDTSAATALASRMAAILFAEYPQLWPEAIRGLIAHSGSWTEAMLAGTPLGEMNLNEKRALIRKFGYGVPSLDAALHSASNSLTLIAQDAIQPFTKDEGASHAKAMEMNIHRLPWPKEVLEGLGAAEARMRVTLSYFIEPNPGSRGSTPTSYKSKYRYASHGLRFDVRSPTESEDLFRARINEEARGDDYEGGGSDADAWLLGPRMRANGSLHSDTWVGSAADLGSKDVIGVFPVTGWWKTRYHLGEWQKYARYALIVTIETPVVDADIYTPVQMQIQIQT